VRAGAASARFQYKMCTFDCGLRAGTIIKMRLLESGQAPRVLYLIHKRDRALAYGAFSTPPEWRAAGLPTNWVSHLLSTVTVGTTECQRPLPASAFESGD